MSINSAQQNFEIIAPPPPPPENQKDVDDETIALATDNNISDMNNSNNNSSVIASTVERRGLIVEVFGNDDRTRRRRRSNFRRMVFGSSGGNNPMVLLIVVLSVFFAGALSVAVRGFINKRMTRTAAAASDISKNVPQQNNDTQEEEEDQTTMLLKNKKFPITIKVNVPEAKYSEGTHHMVYGPIRTTLNSLNNTTTTDNDENILVIKKFTPIKTIGVHHMLLHRAQEPVEPYWEPSYHTAKGPFLFAWAHTGMNYKPFELPKNVGFPVSANTYFALDVHIEMPKEEANQALCLPAYELEVDHVSPDTTQLAGIEFMAPRNINLNPGETDLDVRVTCKVNQDMNVLAYRNHAHDHMTYLFSFNYYQGQQQLVGSSIGADPQVFRPLNPEVILRKNSIITVHCEYQTHSETESVTAGMNLAMHEEMCNQYLMYYPLTENAISCQSSPGFFPQQMLSYMFDDADSHSIRVGQTAGVAHSWDGQYMYVFARRSNEFFSATEIQEETIFQLDVSDNYRIVNRFGGGGLFVTPHGCYVDYLGNIWVTDTSTHEVIKFDSNKSGEILFRLGTRNEPGAGKYQFNKPTDVAVSSKTGDIYVSDGYGNSRVVQFDKDGTFIRSWGGPRGDKEGEFNIPHNIELDEYDNVYVADRQNCRVQVFTSTGDFMNMWVSEFCDPSGGNAAWHGHFSAISYNRSYQIFFCIEGSHLVVRNKFGDVIDVLAGDNDGDGKKEFMWPHDISVPYTGDISSIAVAELDNQRAQIFKPILPRY